MYSKDTLDMVLEKFHEIPFTNKKVACRRQAMQRVLQIDLDFNSIHSVEKWKFYRPVEKNGNNSH